MNSIVLRYVRGLTKLVLMLIGMQTMQFYDFNAWPVADWTTPNANASVPLHRQNGGLDVIDPFYSWTQEYTVISNFVTVIIEIKSIYIKPLGNCNWPHRTSARCPLFRHLSGFRRQYAIAGHASIFQLPWVLKQLRSSRWPPQALVFLSLVAALLRSLIMTTQHWLWSRWYSAATIML